MLEKNEVKNVLEEMIYLLISNLGVYIFDKPQGVGYVRG